MNFTDDPKELRQTLDQEGLLHRMINRIRRSLELQEILSATVAEVRSFLRTDRVKVYKFDVDGSGEVIAESIDEQRLASLLGLHFPADDIPSEAREMFLKARQRSIVDVSSARIGLSPLQCGQTGKAFPSENIRYRRVDDCHIQYLKGMGVQSSLVVPILHHDPKAESAKPQLWGLLVSHHSQPRTIFKRELRVVQQVADQVSIAIAQSNLLTQTRAKQKRETIVNRVTALLHTLPTIQLQKALEIATAAFNGAGGRVYIQQSQELYTCGEQPKLPYELQNSVIEEHPVWQNWIAQGKIGQIRAISDLYKEAHLQVLAVAFQSTRIRGLLMIPLHYRQNFIGVLSIFRKEFDTERLWAGRQDKNQQQRLPRLSFAAWREEKKGLAPEWKPEEISLAQALSHHFAMAIQQQQTYQEMQGVNINLKHLVEEQTAELQKSLQLAKVLKQITDQIHSTLDFKTILQTIVREVRSLLNTDRVVIYQVLGETKGEVVVEDVGASWKSLVKVKTLLGCFPDEYARLYSGGRVRAINNVSAASVSDCHREFLESMQVQANLTVPINMGTRLWGLLVAHECGSPRSWQDAEIDLLQQLAAQAAIAIAQAQLYQASRTAETEATAQATQLVQALHELQETQAQLIQTEKMSSLGQLVAGVAHEINNPVSFIYGNLGYTSEYTEQILKLLRLYQWHYPNPEPEICLAAKSIDLDFLAEDLPKMISSMKVGAERIRSMVLSLRNFSRLDQAQKKPVDLHEGIDSTLLILQHRLKANAEFPGIEVIKEYGNLPLVECYAGQLNQVFMNILSNAIDALQENFEEITNPKIWISTQVCAEKSLLMISIADNGPGMSENVRKRIFDPFFTTKPVGKGTGLGLAISYQIIEKHRGMMKCVSQLGKGTEFQIQIPLLSNC